MNVFVTGGTGGLGRDLVQRLTSDGHQVVMLTRRSLSDCGNARAVIGDILAPESYAGVLKGQDAVLHMAAVTHAVDPDRYYAVNTRGTEALVEAAAAAGVRRFVFVSTRAVGAECGAYGDSKALAEDVVRTSGLAWTILRPAEVYAPPGRQGEENRTLSQSNPGGEAVGRMLEAVRLWPVVPFVAHPRALLAPVCRGDIVAAIARSLDCPAAVGKTYSLAGPEVMTQAALARRLMRLLGRRRPLLPVPVAALRLVVLVSRLLGLSAPPFVPDQIARLLCVKDEATGAAGRDLDFAPRSIEQTLVE